MNYENLVNMNERLLCTRACTGYLRIFETETAVINANQSRQEEQLKQVQSFINWIHKLTKINEKLATNVF